uniref:ATP synthase complex subunit 8 n=1 Tax=Hoplobatrachus rugulosus TaxID=110072 RepID=A0A0A6Z624_HOPRU|nr:ATP synthase F0 subunit 8 [Hoplobatrachus rugulosus]
MPQLCTDPWYMVLLCSWITFIVLPPMKILPHQLLNNPSTQGGSLKTNIWHWTW